MTEIREDVFIIMPLWIQTEHKTEAAAHQSPLASRDAINTCGYLWVPCEYLSYLRLSTGTALHTTFRAGCMYRRPDRYLLAKP